MRWPLISVTEAAVEAWGLQGDTDTLLGSSSAPESTDYTAPAEAA